MLRRGSELGMAYEDTTALAAIDGWFPLPSSRGEDPSGSVMFVCGHGGFLIWNIRPMDI